MLLGEYMLAESSRDCRFSRLRLLELSGLRRRGRGIVGPCLAAGHSASSKMYLLLLPVMKESKPGLFFVLVPREELMELARRQTRSPQSTRPAPWTSGGWGDGLQEAEVQLRALMLCTYGGEGLKMVASLVTVADGRANQAAAPWGLAACSAGQQAITRAGPDIKKGAALAILSRSVGKTQASWGRSGAVSDMYGWEGSCPTSVSLLSISAKGDEIRNSVPSDGYL